MKRVLLIEDQVPFVSQGILEALGGFSVTFVKRGDEALSLFLKERYDLVLLDLRLPGLPGLQVLEALKRIEPDLPVVVVSAFGDKVTRDQSRALGAAAFFQKPPDYRKLHRRMGELIAQREARQAGRMTTMRMDGERLAKYRRLMKLKEQAARAGISTPPEILLEIEDMEAELGYGG